MIMMREISMAGIVIGILEDSHYALRQLRKNLGFTVVAILTLALGIGANTAIFSVVNAVLLRPLPYKDDSRLVVILQKGRNPVAPANFLDWRDQNHVFEQMGAAEYWTSNLTGRNPEKLWALHVSPAMVAMRGVQPWLRRAFLPEKEQTGKENEVLLSFSLWQSHFAGDFGIVGQSVALSGQTYTAVGVMPRQFQFKFARFGATKAELWAPLAFGAQRRDVLELIVLHGMAPAWAGVAAGVAGGLALTRLMSSLLFGTPASDPLTFGAVVVMLSGVAVAASYWPARRASGVDPMVALRCE
jgi:hypothetical protein